MLVTWHLFLLSFRLWDLACSRTFINLALCCSLSSLHTRMLSTITSNPGYHPRHDHMAYVLGWWESNWWSLAHMLNVWRFVLSWSRHFSQYHPGPKLFWHSGFLLLFYLLFLLGSVIFWHICLNHSALPCALLVPWPCASCFTSRKALMEML